MNKKKALVNYYSYKSLNVTTTSPLRQLIDFSIAGATSQHQLTINALIFGASSESLKKASQRASIGSS